MRKQVEALWVLYNKLTIAMVNGSERVAVRNYNIKVRWRLP
jgi:hypothetical protein